ncbi:MAG: TSUP family transporter [Alphaproteobacteria bacterium]
MDAAGLDWSLYWFMLPVGVAVATTAMLTGISGAALMVPVLVIGLPALGPAYALESTSLSVGAALIIQAAGFASGLFGYWRRRLVDVACAVPFLLFAVPAAAVGAAALAAFGQHDAAIKGAYAILMLTLCPMLLLRGRAATAVGAAVAVDATSGGHERTLTARDGRVWHYAVPRPGAGGGALTALGGFLTGLVAVGMGEVLVPQLLRRHRLPPPVAAAVSVFVVIVATLTAALVYTASLAVAAGTVTLPWHLLVWAMAGVVLGGQLGPRLHGRVAQRTMERAIAVLFAAIGVAMAFIALRGAAVL